MVTRLGTRLGTVLGTDIGAFPDNAPSLDLSKAYAISGMAAGNYYTAVNGEAGVNTGFGCALLVQLLSVPTSSMMLLQKRSAAAPPYSGWEMYAAATGDLTFYVMNSAGTVVASGPYRFAANDVGRLFLLVGQLELIVNRSTLAINRARVPLTTTGSTATVRISPEPMDLGHSNGVQSASSFAPIAWRTFHGNLAGASLEALYDQVRALGDIPKQIGGVVVTHGWSVRDELGNAGAPVLNNAPAPAQISDTVTAAPADAFIRTGSAMTIRVIDPSAPRAWGHEASPILYGADGFTLADFFESATNAMPGDAGGFTVSLLCKVTSQTVASTTRRIYAQRGSTNPGWEFATAGTNSSMSFGCGGTNTASSPGSTITAGEVGKLLLYTGVWDGTSVRLYAKRLQVGSGSTLTGGYLPDAAATAMIGRRGSGSPADGVVVYGATYALGAASLAQVQAQFDAVVASERIQHVPGLTGSLVDLTQDFAGGVVSATLTDRGTGGANFARQGAPTASSQYARSFNW